MIIARLRLWGGEYRMDDQGRWSGPDADRAATLRTLGGEGLSVMPPGYVEFYQSVHALREAGVTFEVLQEPPPLAPPPEGVVS